MRAPDVCDGKRRQTVEQPEDLGTVAERHERDLGRDEGMTDEAPCREQSTELCVPRAEVISAPRYASYDAYRELSKMAFG